MTKGYHMDLSTWTLHRRGNKHHGNPTRPQVRLTKSGRFQFNTAATAVLAGVERVHLYSNDDGQVAIVETTDPRGYSVSMVDGIASLTANQIATHHGYPVDTVFTVSAVTGAVILTPEVQR